MSRCVCERARLVGKTPWHGINWWSRLLHRCIPEPGNLVSIFRLVPGTSRKKALRRDVIPGQPAVRELRETSERGPFFIPRHWKCPCLVSSFFYPRDSFFSFRCFLTLLGIAPRTIRWRTRGHARSRMIMVRFPLSHLHFPAFLSAKSHARRAFRACDQPRYATWKARRV